MVETPASHDYDYNASHQTLPLSQQKQCLEWANTRTQVVMTLVSVTDEREMIPTLFIRQHSIDIFISSSSLQSLDKQQSHALEQSPNLPTRVQPVHHFAHL